jgi:multidrug transporter EmrE-like cation transporter
MNYFVFLHTDMENKGFRQLLHESFKSNDTEEWLDIWFTRPIGLAMALLCRRLGITPNMVTIAGILLAMLAGWMFFHSDLAHNVCGVVLLMMSNFCDSADGQLARITNHKTIIGRMLDGLSGDICFFCLYLAVVVRLWNMPIPFTDILWQGWGIVLCAVCGFLIHSPQSTLADYYRQIHLWFLKGDSGSELDSYAKEQQLYEELKRQGWSWERAFHYFYKGYCRKQERMTPQFQAFFQALTTKGNWSEVIDAFLAGSRPLMKYTNILTYNTRAIIFYVAALTNIPWLFPLCDIVLFQPMFLYMRHSHEHLCETLRTKNYNEN